MTSPILVAVFTIVYLAVTVWLCRGLKLNARNLAMGGLACALTLILGSIMIPLPTGASISCGSWIPLRVSRFSLSGDQTETVGSEKNGGEIKHRRM